MEKCEKTSNLNDFCILQKPDEDVARIVWISIIRGEKKLHIEAIRAFENPSHLRWNVESFKKCQGNERVSSAAQ